MRESPARPTDMLHGSLSTLSLAGLLQLLSSEGRSGRLDVRPEGGRSVPGSIWLESGRVVHAEHGRAEGEEALYEIVSVEEGGFGFEPGPRSARRTIQASTEHLLMEAACRRDHLRRGPPAVRATDVPVFAPVPEGRSTPRFNTLQWRILASMDGRKDVSHLAREIGIPEPATCQLVGELVAAGVLQVAASRT